ncbi:MAG: DPP IV N-terminal domain-containing protein, partial [Planctomycetota bacterium]
MMRYAKQAMWLVIPCSTGLAGCGVFPSAQRGPTEAQLAGAPAFRTAQPSEVGGSAGPTLRPGTSRVAPPIPVPSSVQPLTLADHSVAETEPLAEASTAEPATPPPAAEPTAAEAATTPAPRPARVTTPVSAPDPRRVSLHRFGELDDLSVPNASPLDDQGDLRRVTFTHEGADFDVDTDPTGRWLAFASTRHRATSDIYLQRVDGTAVTQLTADPGNDVMPAVSPDGRRVAFASDRGGTWDLYLMDIDGGPAVKLTDDGAHNLHPSFSPDGRQLVYCSRGSRSGVWELVLIDLDAPAHRRIIGHGLFPAWSPSGDTIAFQRARQRGSRWFSVWTVELIDGEPRRPTEVAASSNAAIITPEWSPDGRSLVFCTVLDPTTDSPVGSRADLWVSNADGTGRA